MVKLIGRLHFESTCIAVRVKNIVAVTVCNGMPIPPHSKTMTKRNQFGAATGTKEVTMTLKKIRALGLVIPIKNPNLKAQTGPAERSNFLLELVSIFGILVSDLLNKLNPIQPKYVVPNSLKTKVNSGKDSSIE